MFSEEDDHLSILLGLHQGISVHGPAWCPWVVEVVEECQSWKCGLVDSQQTHDMVPVMKYRMTRRHGHQFPWKRRQGLLVLWTTEGQQHSPEWWGVWGDGVRHRYEKN